MTELLTLTEVTKHYSANDVDALAATSLKISRGERVAIVGTTGCGKSTLLRIIAGVEKPTSGSLHWASTPTLGHMPQDLGLYDWLSVRDNVALGLRLQKVSKSQARQQATEILSTFGLADFARAWPHQLSGGMRSRVAFLRTMLVKPDLITLDEPFSALDAITRRELHEWLRRVLDERKQTMLLVTHDIEEAVYLADRVLVMSPRPGRLTLSFGTSEHNQSSNQRTMEFFAICQDIHQALQQHP